MKLYIGHYATYGEDELANEERNHSVMDLATPQFAKVGTDGDEVLETMKGVAADAAEYAYGGVPAKWVRDDYECVPNDREVWALEQDGPEGETLAIVVVKTVEV